MENVAVTSCPPGPSPVVKVASGLIGPVGVGDAGGAARTELLMFGVLFSAVVVAAALVLEGLESDFLSSLLHVETRAKKPTTPARATRTVVPESSLAGLGSSGGGTGGGGAVGAAGPQFGPSKYR